MLAAVWCLQMEVVDWSDVERILALLRTRGPVLRSLEARAEHMMLTIEVAADEDQVALLRHRLGRFLGVRHESLVSTRAGSLAMTIDE